jgi:hypothetical protein
MILGNKEKQHSSIFVTQDFFFRYSPVDSHMWNTHLKENMVEGTNFIIINQEIWEYFEKYLI